MTNQDLYKKFINYKNKNKEITYKFIADKLNTSSGSVHDKFTRLKNGRSVNTQFLIDIERVFGSFNFFLKIKLVFLRAKFFTNFNYQF